MRIVRRIFLAVAAFAAFAGYVWVSATRAAPAVRRRKAEARAARRAS